MNQDNNVVNNTQDNNGIPNDQSLNNQNSNNSSSKKKNIIIILLSIVIFCLVGYLVYDNLALDENVGNDIKNDNSPVIEDEDNNFETDIKDENDITLENEYTDLEVVDYINKKFDKNTINKDFLMQYRVCGDIASERLLGSNEVILPMIKSTKQGAEQLNKIIQTEYQGEIELLSEEGIKNQIEKIEQENPNLIDKMNGSILGGSSSTTYEYKNSDGYISILITSGGGSACAGGSYSTYSYVYDIKNDKYLTNEDVIKKFNITKEMIKNAIIKHQPNLAQDPGIESVLNDSFEDLFYLSIQNGTLIIGSNRGLGDNRPQNVEFSI